ncbi:MAG: flagellar biosynthetic protein FliQ [Planctomycetes bacterium]|nr:flagellar biosynthetic protein FliQ [Planctomycetota bacterium]
MAETDLVELVRESLLAGVTVLMPVLATVLVVGILTGLVQAATGVHEPAVGLVPRLFATGLVLLWTLPWMVERMTDLVRVAASGP